MHSANKVNTNEPLEWFDIPLTNSSYVIPAGRTPQYTKDQLGWVRLQGYLLSETSGNIPPGEVFATLPTGFRPAIGINIPIAIAFSDGGVTYSDVFGLSIHSAGGMHIRKSKYSSSFSGGAIDLTNISFYVGNIL